MSTTRWWRNWWPRREVRRTRTAASCSRAPSRQRGARGRTSAGAPCRRPPWPGSDRASWQSTGRMISTACAGPRSSGPLSTGSVATRWTPPARPIGGPSTSWLTCFAGGRTSSPMPPSGHARQPTCASPSRPSIDLPPRRARRRPCGTRRAGSRTRTRSCARWRRRAKRSRPMRAPRLPRSAPRPRRWRARPSAIPPWGRWPSGCSACLPSPSTSPRISRATSTTWMRIPGGSTRSRSAGVPWATCAAGWSAAARGRNSPPTRSRGARPLSHA